MTRSLGKASRFKEKMRTTGRAFMHWKMFAFFSRQRKLNDRLLDTTIQKKYLKKAWNGWQAHHEHTKIKRIEAAKKKEADEYVEMISMKYQKEISTLQTKLSELTAEINASNQHKKDMQNQLKRAFMRGLCAMNLEAMDVLNPEDAIRQGEMVLTKEELATLNSIEKKSSQNTNNQSQTSSTRYQTDRLQEQLPYTSIYKPEQEFTYSKKPDPRPAPEYNSLNMAIKENMKHEYAALYSHDEAIKGSDIDKPYDYGKYRSAASNGMADGRQDMSKHTHTNEDDIHSTYRIDRGKSENVDDMYENMLREFNIKSEVLGNVSSEATGQSMKENRKVTIMSEPLVDSSLCRLSPKSIFGVKHQS